MEVEIKNWEEYQGRKDVKHPTWFRVDNDIMVSRKLFRLDAETKWLFICLLAAASKKKGEKFTCEPEYFSYQTGISIKNIEKAIKDLAARDLLIISDSSQICTDPLHARTDLALTDRQTDRQTRVRARPNTDEGKEKIDDKCNKIGGMWNQVAEAVGLPKVRLPLSKDRVDSVKVALKEFPDHKDWIAILSQIDKNPHNLGKNDRGWKANFDWLFYKTKFNYRKLWEAYESENCNGICNPEG